MNFVWIIKRRGTGELIGIWADEESVPDRYMDGDEDYSLFQMLVLGTPYSLEIVKRGDLDPSMIRTERD